MDLERELAQLLKGVRVPPLDDPVGGVRAGLRRHQRVRRVQAATAALAVVGVAVGASLLLGGSSPRGVAPVPGASAELTTSPTTGPTSGPTTSTTPEPTTGATPPFAGGVGADLSWVSIDNGFAIATTRCGNATCTRFLRTTDGGRTWTRVQTTGLPSTCSVPCPLRVRFADVFFGYAYGDGLFLTTDGGRTWTRQPGLDTYGLEIARNTVLRVVTSDACPGCAFDVERSAIGSSSWQRVYRSDMTLTAADLTRQGDDVAVTLKRNPAGGAGNAQSTLLISQDAGTSWQRHDDPCGGSGEDEVDAVQVTWAHDGQLLVLCQRRMWRSNGGNSTLLVSSDQGRTFAAPQGFPEATDAWLVAGGHDVLLAETHQGNDDRVALQRSTDGGRTWVEVARAPLPDGYTAGYLAFSTDQTVSWATPNGETVLRSSDAGATWRTYPLG